MNLPRPVPVGILMTSFHPGGTERQMTELMTRLDRRQFAVHVACFHREGEWLSRVEEQVDSLTEFPVESFHSTSMQRHGRAFLRWCREYSLAVFQSCDLYANIFGQPLAALAGVPVRIASRRELNPDKSASQIAAQRMAYAFAHTVVANSSAAARRLRLEGVRASRVVRIPNGIDLDRFHPASSARPPRHIVSVARFRQEKALDILLDAMALLVRDNPHLTLTLVGDGPMAPDLAIRVTALGLDHHVSMPGHIENVAETLRSADIFALPSRSEAFPNAVLEAMATGLPVVASRVGGIPELVDHGRTGLLVRPGRPEALFEAIGHLVRHPASAREMGRLARRRVEATYSFERMVGAFEGLYHRALGSRRRVAAIRSHEQPVIS